MNKYLLIITTLLFTVAFSQEDTTFVQAHDYVDMDAHGNFDAWAVFPDDNNSYRKILMHYDLKCASPQADWPGCSGWDYTTKVSLLKPTLDSDGNISFIHDQTLANVVTPYGTYMMGNGSNGFSPNWVHRYTYDVTDFAPLLRDSVLIRAFYGGWPQPNSANAPNAAGAFNITLNFEMIEGTPPRNVTDITNLWSGSQSYSALQNISDSNVYISPESNNAMLRVTVSGHGVNGEFSDGVNYYIDINAENQYIQEIWRDDCGENPLYPQGGTWIYDRANWCPGDKATTREHELTDFLISGQDNLISFDIYKPNNVSWYDSSSGESSASYIYDAQLFTFTEPNFNLDVAIEEILSPSIKKEHFRYNPTCSNPIVKIKNQGSNNLTSVSIVYGFDGEEASNFVWEGDLAFSETEIVELPPIDWPSWDENIPFYARVEMPNFLTDEYNVNDVLYSEYEFVDEYTNSFAVHFKTNWAPNESSYKLFDNFGNILFEKSFSGLEPQTVYKDTFNLEPGCYKLQFLDVGGNNNSNEDGLNWFNNNDGYCVPGNPNYSDCGYIRLRSVPGPYIKYYEGDFGTELTDFFRVGEYSVDLNSNSIEPVIEIYPNPTQDKLIIDLDLLYNSDIQILITDIKGKIIRDVSQNNFSSGTLKLDLNDLNNGIYNCAIKTNDKVYNEKVILIK